MTVTQKLKALRTALNLTQDKFGDILGISGPYYGEVERGRYAEPSTTPGNTETIQTLYLM